MTAMSAEPKRVKETPGSIALRILFFVLLFIAVIVALGFPLQQAIDAAAKASCPADSFFRGSRSGMPFVLGALLPLLIGPSAALVLTMIIFRVILRRERTEPLGRILITGSTWVTLGALLLYLCDFPAIVSPSYCISPGGVSVWAHPGKQLVSYNWADARWLSVTCFRSSGRSSNSWDESLILTMADGATFGVGNYEWSEKRPLSQRYTDLASNLKRSPARLDLSGVAPGCNPRALDLFRQ
jgi:hypothetical protein